MPCLKFWYWKCTRPLLAFISWTPVWASPWPCVTLPLRCRHVHRRSAFASNDISYLRGSSLSPVAWGQTCQSPRHWNWMGLGIQSAAYLPSHCVALIHLLLHRMHHSLQEFFLRSKSCWKIDFRESNMGSGLGSVMALFNLPTDWPTQSNFLARRPFPNP